MIFAFFELSILLGCCCWTSVSSCVILIGRLLTRAIFCSIHWKKWSLITHDHWSTLSQSLSSSFLVMCSSTSCLFSHRLVRYWRNNGSQISNISWFVETKMLWHLLWCTKVVRRVFPKLSWPLLSTIRHHFFSNIGWYIFKQSRSCSIYFWFVSVSGLINSWFLFISSNCGSSRSKYNYWKPPAESVFDKEASNC